MNIISIDGQILSVSGSNISIINGKIFCDGVVVSGFDTNSGQTVKIVWEGPAANISTSYSLECGDIQGDVTAKGSVKCGNVNKNVDASGSVECGNVEGSINAGGSVMVRGKVSGSVRAGGSVSMS